MATVRDGSKAAVLVVDVQAGVMEGAWDADRIVSNVAQVVQRARSQQVPVVWVQHSDDELVRGSDAWSLVPELVPDEGEPVVHKSYNSAFEATGLEEELDRLGASHVVLAGAATNWCIRATAYGALDRGYDLTLVRDAHTTETMELDDGTKVEASSIIDDLNTCMTWVEYPGRSSATASAADVDFATPGDERNP
jgi:nicotinamidase-related amidase